MQLNKKLLKRLYTFLVFPIFSLLSLVTDEIITRSISVLIIVGWAGILIFIRDYQHVDEEIDEIVGPPVLDPTLSQPTVKRNSEIQTGQNEAIKIIVPDNKPIEAAKQEDKHVDKLATKPEEERHFVKPKDFKKQYEVIAQQDFPRNTSGDEQFSFILDIFLTIIKDLFEANTAIFYWYNKSKKRLSLEKYVSECSDFKFEKLTLEDDILSKIATNEEPEVLANIPANAELDNIRYYNSPQSIKSFVGVPLYFDKKITGILAIDSRHSFAFDIQHVFSLGRFSRILSMVISIFETKGSEAQAEKRLESLLGVINSNLIFKSETELAELLEKSARNLLEYDAMSILYFYNSEKKFKAIKVVNNTPLDYIEEGTFIELNNTLVGKSIKTKQLLKVDDTGLNAVIRYTYKESVKFEGSFLAIPLSYEEEIYGVVCFENLKKGYFNNNDIKILKHAVKLYGFIIYSFAMQSMLKELLTLEPETKVLTKNEFVNRVKQMLLITKDFNKNCTLVLLHIDSFIDENTLFDNNAFPKVQKAILEIVKSESDHNFLVGKIKDRIFGIFILNSTTNDAYSWAERIRIKIARNPLSELPSHAIHTISLGVSNANVGKSIELIFEDAEMALKKAIEKGGNNTKVA